MRPSRRKKRSRSSPFEVLADSDKSYGALNSNSITRFNTELDHMPVSADIFNEAFMRDIGAVSVEDMITSFSAGAGSALATPSTSSANTQPRRSQRELLSSRSRGLTAPTMQTRRIHAREHLHPVRRDRHGFLEQLRHRARRSD